MPAQRHHLRVPHRDAGHVVHRDGARVVGQQVGRRPAHRAQRLVDAPGQGAHLLVPDRDDHPEPGPGQPPREQLRLPAPDPRPVAPVPLQPHPRLGDPRPGSAFAGPRAMPASPPRPLAGSTAPTPGSPSRPACGARRPPRIFPFDRSTSSSNLVHEPVDQPRPCRLRQRVPAGVPDRHVTGDRLRIAPGQLRSRPGRPVRSNASKISITSLPNLVTGPSGLRWVRRTTSNPSTPEGPSASRHAVVQSGQENRPPTQAINGPQGWRNDGRDQELTDRTPVFSRGR